MERELRMSQADRQLWDRLTEWSVCRIAVYLNRMEEEQKRLAGGEPTGIKGKSDRPSTRTQSNPIDVDATEVDDIDDDDPGTPPPFNKN